MEEMGFGVDSMTCALVTGRSGVTALLFCVWI